VSACLKNKDITFRFLYSMKMCVVVVLKSNGVSNRRTTVAYRLWHCHCHKKAMHIVNCH